MADPEPIQASIALAAYAEPLMQGSRVIVFGDASSGLADRLLERGARLVHVYDPDAGRVAEAAARNASRAVTFAPLDDGDLAIRDAAFELAVVENLAALPAPNELLGKVRRALSPRAVALVATPNPDVTRRLLGDSGQPYALDYYSFYDLVAAEFEQVQMLGQTPFVGYAVAAFAPQDEPAPAFDSGFIPGGAEEPEWFIALGSQHELAIEEFSVIQVPFASTVRSAPAAAPSPPTTNREPRRTRERAPRADLDALRKQLAERDEWIAQLEARATAADSRADEIQAELEAAEAERAATTDRRADEIQAQLEAAEAERAATTDRRADEIQAQLEAAEAERATATERAAKFEAKFEQTRRDADAARRQTRSLERELDELRKARDERQVQEQQLHLLQGIEAEAGRDIERLEQQLHERAQEIQRLQRDLREAERIGKELLGDLSVKPAPDVRTAELAGRLDALAALNAQREGDLAAARYHIGQLEAELKESGAAPSAQTEELQRELDRARAELQQQAVLLEQSRSGQGPEASGSA